MEIRKGKQLKRRRVLLYGDNGWGKSTWAAAWPKPLVVNLEDGINDIDVDSTNRLYTWEEVEQCFEHLRDTPNPYQTIVVDTIDWVEKVIFDQVAADAGAPTVEAIGYGKGYEHVERYWRDFIALLEPLWNGGRHIVMTCHSKIAKFKDPEGDAYDYHSPRLHDRGSEILCQWCDEVLFCKFRVSKGTVKEGFNNKRTIAHGGDRLICTTEAASHVAKNRLGIVGEIGPTFAEFNEKLLLAQGNKKVVSNG